MKNSYQALAAVTKGNNANEKQAKTFQQILWLHLASSFFRCWGVVASCQGAGVCAEAVNLRMEFLAVNAQ